MADRELNTRGVLRMECKRSCCARMLETNVSHVRNGANSRSCNRETQETKPSHGLAAYDIALSKSSVHPRDILKGG